MLEMGLENNSPNLLRYENDDWLLESTLEMYDGDTLSTLGYQANVVICQIRVLHHQGKPKLDICWSLEESPK